MIFVVARETTNEDNLNLLVHMHLGRLASARREVRGLDVE